MHTYIHANIHTCTHTFIGPFASIVVQDGAFFPFFLLQHGRPHTLIAAFRTGTNGKAHHVFHKRKEGKTMKYTLSLVPVAIIKKRK